MSSIKKEENNKNGSNDPEVIFNLFINRLIGPNKVSTYSKFKTRKYSTWKVNLKPFLI